MDLLGALESAVRSSTEGRDVAVAFSGGLDSGTVAVLASRYARSVRLYTVGTEDSYDVRASREMAAVLGIGWEHIVLDDTVLTDVIRDSVRITGTRDPVTLSFEVPLTVILSRVKERYVIGGQGADEMLCGYSKYLDLAEDELKAAVARDMATLESVTLPHERALADHYGKEVLHPFLSGAVKEAVAGLSYDDLRPVGDDRKRPLRAAAEKLGHPEIASKPKKAAQYGSGSMNMMKRLSKSKGMSLSEWIDSLSEGS